MGRVRSNALTGPSDPRFLPASKLLQMELSQPFVMDPTLRGFLRTIYDNQTLMSEPERLADKIYGLYSDSDVPSAEPSREDMQNYVKRLAGALAKGRFREPPRLQAVEPEMTLADLILLADDESNARHFANRCTKFIYFMVSATQGPAAIRVYANVMFAFVPDIAVALVEFGKDPKSGVLDFKVVGPAAVKRRKDAVVIYCSSMEAAQTVANLLLDKFSRSFNASVPTMTTQIRPGVGVAVGAEPIWQGTGMEGPKLSPNDHSARSYNAQSFGSIRCELIAMAIINFNANKNVVGNTFDNFVKFVAVAFRGYGLDPARPGD